MFNSPILDLAIALSFTYFILGLVVSVIHEFIYSVLSSKRGKFLKRAIQNLFFDDEWKKLSAKILDSEYIVALKENENREPSYIPAKNFALALIEQFRTHDSSLDMNHIRLILTNNTKAQTKGISDSFRNILLGFYERSKGDLQVFQKHIETFYNDAMDRAAGVYVRSTKKALLVISIIIAVALNADTINIAKKLWSDQGALKLTADNINKTIKEFNETNKANIDLKDIKFDGEKLIIVKKDSSVMKNNDSIHVINTVKEVNNTVIYLQNAGVPIGWTKENIPQIQKGFCKNLWNWITKLFGIFLSAIALSLGAPFWFDLLNKIVNLRATGKKTDNDKKDKNNTSADLTVKAVGQ